VGLPSIDDLRLLPDLAKLFGVKVHVKLFRVCEESSQDIARRMAEEGAEEWTTVVCEEMRGGRGRMGRRWYAPRGGLWMTVILRPPIVEGLQLLSIAAGLAVAEAIRLLTGVDARVKWPNDVVVRGRKVCGVLVEGSAMGGRALLLLGVGVNVNNDVPEELRGYAASLKGLTGREIPRASLALLILQRLRGYYAAVLSGRGEEVLEGFRRLSETLGRWIRVELTDGAECVCRAVDIDGFGRLVADCGSARRLLDSADVVHLRHLSALSALIYRALKALKRGVAR